jgi:AraC-like DNA-binding protein
MLDPLSDVLSFLRVESALSARLEARGSWSLSFPACHQVLFGAVVEGSMFLAADSSAKPIEIKAGDCYLLTRGQEYQFGTSLAARCENGRRVFDTRKKNGIVKYGKGDLSLVWAGGSFRLDDDSGDLLLDLLPPVIHLPAGSVDQAPLRTVFNLIATETSSPQPGAGAIAGSLANLVLVQMLRVYLKTTTRPPGWLAAIADEHIGNAVAIVHTQYAEHWTVEDLANKVGMSRTAFAVRFKTLVGLPPLEYLTQWRMVIARRALKAGKSLSVVAESVGYASDTAFNAAFKRATGQSPGRYRSIETTHRA